MKWNSYFFIFIGVSIITFLISLPFSRTSTADLLQNNQHSCSLSSFNPRVPGLNSLSIAQFDGALPTGRVHVLHEQNDKSVLLTRREPKILQIAIINKKSNQIELITEGPLRPLKLISAADEWIINCD